MISYEESRLPVRADIVQAHNVAWGRLARAGSWLDGKTRVAIAAETRHAPQCELCRRRKEALSPYSIAGQHDSLGTLPERIVEQIHRIVSDPGRLTRKWFDGVIAFGTSDVEYVEIIGVIATVVSIDTIAVPSVCLLALSQTPCRGSRTGDVRGPHISEARLGCR